MKIGSKITLACLSIILIAVLIEASFVFQVQLFAGKIKAEIPSTIENLSSASYLDSIAQSILYYDEVLTQAARNYAFTGDEKWKEKYYETMEILDKKIKEAISMENDADKKIFEVVNNSNLALVEMEENSLSLADSGKSEEAIKILESKEYWDQKMIYSESLIQYLDKRSAAYQDALAASRKIAGNLEKDIDQSFFSLILVFISSIIAGILIATIIIWRLTKSILRPLSSLKSGMKEIIKGNLDKRVIVDSKDELKELADYFNSMAESLKESRTDIEKKSEKKDG